MNSKVSKYDLYEDVKSRLKGHNMMVSEYTEINYGLQFDLNDGIQSFLVRIYEGKKGTRIDLSQVKDSKTLSKLSGFLDLTISTTSDSMNSQEGNKSIDYPAEIIGTDESGKGDYFGPLVVAGVYANQTTADKLQRIGVMDSKKLTDKQIEVLAEEIKLSCKYSIVAIGNAKYNELYHRIKNLNALLAWGHARAIENLLEKVECTYALSDQFGDERYIENALMEKGKKVVLFQRPKAEEVTAVAAASVIARNEYVLRLRRLSQKYGIDLPKGASTQVIERARMIVQKYGFEELRNVAKLHFKTTDQV